MCERSADTYFISGLKPMFAMYTASTMMRLWAIAKSKYYPFHSFSYGIILFLVVFGAQRRLRCCTQLNTESFPAIKLYSVGADRRQAAYMRYIAVLLVNVRRLWRSRITRMRKWINLFYYFLLFRAINEYCRRQWCTEKFWAIAPVAVTQPEQHSAKL